MYGALGGTGAKVSMGRGPGAVILGLLGIMLLVGCSANSGDPYTALTPGPTPQSHPGSYVWVCGVPDLIIGSADGGASWQVRSRRVNGDIMAGDLWAIAFGDVDHGWAVRRGIGHRQASLLATADAGQTWSEQFIGTKNGRLLAVAATDARHVWAVGYQYVKGSDYPNPPGKGLVLASTDGGGTWQRQRVPAGVSLFRVAFADTRHGWMLNGWGNNVLQTTDGGAHWRVSYTAPQGVSLRDVVPLGTKGCCVVGYGEHPQSGFVVRTSDGGRHWNASASVSPQGLLAVSFPDASRGWAVGYGGTVIATTDGGATWQARNAGGDYQLEQVSFSDLRHGWALIGHWGYSPPATEARRGRWCGRRTPGIS
jgi:photosystem II stability/assembly factor-like uncharacterized protein